MNSRSSFTLIELLVVIAILAILSIAVVLVINPLDLIKQSRDSTRLTDLNKIDKALALFDVTNPDDFTGTSTIVYVSIPDSTSTCVNLSLPTLPGGYTYQCVTSSTLSLTDGTGWIPVNFNNISYGSPLNKLPVDPVNSTSSGEYYTYIMGGSWKLTALLTSEKYASKMNEDGGPNLGTLEIGSNPNLLPGLGNLLTYLKFNEGTGTSASDSSANNKTAILTNGATWNTSDCKEGYCASFDGINDYASSSNPLGGGTKPRTIALWTKPTANTNATLAFAAASGNYIGFRFNRTSNTNISFVVGSTDGSNGSSVSKTSGTPINEWTFLVGTYDGANIRLFVNGVEAGNSAFTMTPYSPPYVTIGASDDGLGGYFTGLIDEFRIYQRALSATEISAIYNSTR